MDKSILHQKRSSNNSLDVTATVLRQGVDSHSDNDSPPDCNIAVSDLKVRGKFEYDVGYEKGYSDALNAVQQIIIDAPSLCKNCFSTQGQCERNILDRKTRCCNDCWHCYINQVEIENKVSKLKEKGVKNG
jgi:hypothetical protein